MNIEQIGAPSSLAASLALISFRHDSLLTVFVMYNNSLSKEHLASQVIGII